ncbi:MAG: hypothetical protein WBA67_14295 [Jannaschia sp.]
MNFTSLEDLTARARDLGAGPVLLILCEDDVELTGTLRHHAMIGFQSIVLALPPGIAVPTTLPAGTHTLRLSERPGDMATACVNALIAGRPAGAWVAYVYNAEYLFTAFSETRTVGEAMQFCAEERRNAILTFVIDLYAEHLAPGSNAVDPDAAWMDQEGYFALARWDEAAGAAKERQLDYFGGLRWRFEEHVPWERRRIDRVAMFRVRKGLTLLPDHRLSDEELNTVQAPWHHSMTACIASFRAAKALATNPGSRAAIRALKWDGSIPFEWRSQQLMDLGLMEPGQWF